MKIITDSSILTKIDYVYDKIDLLSVETSELLSQVDVVNYSKLVDNINTIANQGVTSIDLYLKTYTINNKVFPISYLCAAERLFLISTVSELVGKTVCISYDIFSLTPSIRKQFFEMFRNNNYLYLYVPDDYGMYEYLFKEELSNG